MRTHFLFGEGTVTSEDKKYIQNKIDKLEKLFNNYDAPDELFAEIDLGQNKKGFWRLEIMIKTPRNLYRVEKIDEIITEAMDQAEDVLKKQIRRKSEKRKDLKERGGRSIKKKTVVDEKARF